MQLQAEHAYRVFYRDYVHQVSISSTQPEPLAAGRLGALAEQLLQHADNFLGVVDDQENILQLTDAVGYYFAKEGQEFLHPVAAFVVTSDGTIVRYLIGQRFLPLDLSMALFEASEGRIGTPIRKALEFCFTYDPEGRRYVFNLLRVSGTVILLTLGSFLLFLIISGRKKKQ